MRQKKIYSFYLFKGNGLDTHRYYETVLMGSIPVVENSTLYPIYKRTTSLIVVNFENLTMDMLEKPLIFTTNFEFSKKILFIDYWWNKIEEYRSFLKPSLNK